MFASFNGKDAALRTLRCGFKSCRERQFLVEWKMTMPAIAYIPDFTRDAGALFDRLVTAVIWDERMRARKTASFGVSYDYAQIAYPKAPMLPELDELIGRLDGAIGYRANNCLLNYYPDG